MKTSPTGWWRPFRFSFPARFHVTQVGLSRLSRGTMDREIWDYAAQQGFATSTADNDFLTLAGALGPSPNIILLENCDYPTSVAARLISATPSASLNSTVTIARS